MNVIPLLISIVAAMPATAVLTSRAIDSPEARIFALSRATSTLEGRSPDVLSVADVSLVAGGTAVFSTQGWGGQLPYAWFTAFMTPQSPSAT